MHVKMYVTLLLAAKIMQICLASQVCEDSGYCSTDMKPFYGNIVSGKCAAGNSTIRGKADL